MLPNKEDNNQKVFITKSNDFFINQLDNANQLIHKNLDQVNKLKKQRQALILGIIALLTISIVYISTSFNQQIVAHQAQQITTNHFPLPNIKKPITIVKPVVKPKNTKKTPIIALKAIQKPVKENLINIDFKKNEDLERLITGMRDVNNAFSIENTQSQIRFTLNTKINTTIEILSNNPLKPPVINGKPNMVISKSSFSNGLYYYVITDNEAMKVVKVGKFTIQHQQ